MVEVCADHPVTCDVQRSCLHARRYPQSGYDAWFWFTTLFLRDNGCGGCPTSLHTIGRQQITDLLSMCDGHVPCFFIMLDFHYQGMSYLAFTPAFESRQYLVTQCLLEIGSYKHKQVVNPIDALAMLANEQSRITMAMYEIKLMQQLN